MSFKNFLGCTLVATVMIGLIFFHIYPAIHCAWLNSQLNDKKVELKGVECQWSQYCKMQEGDPLRTATKNRKVMLETEIKVLEENINYWSRLYNRAPFYLTP